MHRWLGVLLLFSGCAFGLTGPDPDRPRSKAPECDTGKGLVALDGIVAATAGIVALSLVSESEPAVALVPLAIGSLYVGGAIRGNNNVNACRKAMGEYESYLAARDTEDVPRRVKVPESDIALATAATPAMTTPAVPTAVVPAPASSGLPAPVSAAKPAAKPAPAPAKHDNDDWSDFWKEVE